MFKSRSKISAPTLFWMMQQLAMLLTANIPLLHALQTINNAQQQTPMAKLLNTIMHAINSGLSFSQALKPYPEYFSSFTCHLIQAGEQAAALPLALTQWTIYQMQLKQLAQKLRKALFYPSVVISLSFVITLGLLLFIVPQFQQLFANFNAPLPWLTQIILKFTALLKKYGFYAMIVLIILLAITKIMIKYFPAIANRLATWQLVLPIVGQWQRYAITARIVRTLALTTTHHIPLTQGLTLSSGIAANWQYQEALRYTKIAIAQGETLSSALQKTNCFDLFFIQLVRTGEQSGRLAYLLTQAADWYDSQLDQAIEQLSQWLEPIMMTVLGVIIGGLVIAMYLPIFQLGKIV